MAEIAEMDEFEKRMHFTAFVTTLSDVVSKMNPATLLGRDSQALVETAGLKDKANGAVNKWLDMVIAFSEKATILGSKYPIEAILGIEVGPKT